jgi:hypothetical protein
LLAVIALLLDKAVGLIKGVKLPAQSGVGAAAIKSAGVDKTRGAPQAYLS